MKQEKVNGIKHVCKRLIMMMLWKKYKVVSEITKGKISVLQVLVGKATLEQWVRESEQGT